ncbi:hypothetical protein ES707_05826 [subsurface metagenome]
MLSRFTRHAALAVTMGAAGSNAFAAASDYAFEAVEAELKKGDDVTVAVHLTNKLTGKPVTDAVIFRSRVDMAPDGMAEMESQVTPLPAQEPGVYAFKTDLPMAGRYQLSVAAKVQGEAETVIGRIVITASK